jgi:hypothetical protein
MKLRQEYIDFIANLLVDKLIEEGYLEPVEDSKAIKTRVSRVITEDLKVEDRLDEEVRNILENYTEIMRKENIPYHEMFRRVKQKLVKERNLIL